MAEGIKVGDAFLLLGLDSSELDADMKRLQGKMRSVQKAIGVGMVALGGAVLAGFTMAMKSAAEFETAMREVNTMMGLSQEEFSAFSKEVRNMSSEMGVNAVESAQALYQAISAGIPRENAIEFLRVATKAAIGGVTDTATAVDGLTTVINAFKLPISQAEHVADIMFTTVKGGKTTMEELSASLFNVAPIAAASGVKIEEVAAALATMTKQGVPTAQATTQLRQAIVGLKKPTAEMEELINSLGYASGTTMLKALGLKGAFAEVTEYARANNIEITDLFESVEGGSAALALTGENAQTFANDLDAMANAAGAAEAAFLEMEESASRKLAHLKESFNDIMLTIGDVLLPLLVDLLDKIKPVFDTIRDWAEEHPGLTKVIIIGTTALAGLSVALGTLILLLPHLIAGFTALSGLFVTTAGTSGTLTLGISALTAGLGLLGIAIGAAMVAFGAYLFYVNSQIDAYNEKVKEVFDYFNEEMAKQGKGLDSDWLQAAVNVLAIYESWIKAGKELNAENLQQYEYLKKIVAEEIKRRDLIWEQEQVEKNLTEWIAARKAQIAAEEIAALEALKKQRDDLNEKAREELHIINQQTAAMVSQWAAQEARMRGIMEKGILGLPTSEQVASMTSQDMANYWATTLDMLQSGTNLEYMPPGLLDWSLGAPNAAGIQAAIDRAQNWRDFYHNEAGLSGMQYGGIAMRPITTRIAERQPEAVIPLDKLSSLLGGGREIHVHWQVGDREIAEAVVGPLGALLLERQQLEGR